LPLDNGAVIRVQGDGRCRRARAPRIDFSGTSAQLPNNFNAPKAVTMAAVLYVFRTLVDDDIPLNAGCLKPLQVIVPEGCMLNPNPPAAVVAGNVETSMCVTNALYGALGVMAASQCTMNNFTFGNTTHQYYETISGGAGAGPDFDGASVVQTHMTNSRLTDPEVLEFRFPGAAGKLCHPPRVGRRRALAGRRRRRAPGALPAGDDGVHPQQRPPSRRLRHGRRAAGRGGRRTGSSGRRPRRGAGPHRLGRDGAGRRVRDRDPRGWRLRRGREIIDQNRLIPASNGH
jgi:hypothetical protein